MELNSKDELQSTLDEILSRLSVVEQSMTEKPDDTEKHDETEKQETKEEPDVESVDEIEKLLNA